MVKLTFKIEEEKTIELKDIVASELKVTVEEIGIKATENEEKVSKRFKELINYEKQNQYINTSSKSNKDIIDELLNHLKNSI